MRFLFHNDTPFNKMNLASDTWMRLRHGEGEEEIENHGWSRVESFSQETEARGQQRSRSDQNEPKLHSQSQVQDAHDSPTQLPFFSLPRYSKSQRRAGTRPSGLVTPLGALRTVLALGVLGWHRLFFLFSFLSAFAGRSWRCGTCAPSGVIKPLGLATLFSYFQFTKKGQAHFFVFGFVFSGMFFGSSALAYMPMGKTYREPPVQKSADEKLRDVSNMYEKHFLREMLKAMRSTVHEGGFVQSNHAEKIFREQLDDQYVERWGERGGIGLSQLIYDQLIERYGAAMGLKIPMQKPQGPLPLDEKSNVALKPFQHPGKKQALSYRFDNRGKSLDIKSPWDGVLLGKKNLVDNQTLVEIKHDNGLKSQMVFSGSLAQVSDGQKLQAGETLGVLSPEGKSLYWTVEAGPQGVSE